MPGVTLEGLGYAPSSSGTERGRPPTNQNCSTDYNSRSRSVGHSREDLDNMEAKPIDSKSKFHSAKALFEDLEKRQTPATNKPVAYGSPVGAKRHLGGGGFKFDPVGGGLVSRSEPQSVVASPRPPSGQGSPRKAGPPPLPPKPRFDSPRVPVAPPPKPDPPPGQRPTPVADVVQPNREASPLTEMTRHFNELVSDLEKMNGEWRAASSGGTMSGSYHPEAGSNGTSESSPLVRGESNRNSTGSSSAIRYPRITESLRMDKAHGEPAADSPRRVQQPAPQEDPTQAGNIGGNLSKPSSLYMPYWRQHSYYNRLFGGGAANGGVAAAINESPTDARQQQLEQQQQQLEGRQSPAYTNGGGTAVAGNGTTYALVRSKKPEGPAAYRGDGRQTTDSNDSGKQIISAEQRY